MECTKAHKKSLSQFTWFQQVLTLSHWNRAPCLNAGKNKPGEHVVPKPLPRGLKTANAGQHAPGNMPRGFRGKKKQVFLIPCIQRSTKTKAHPRDIPPFREVFHSSTRSSLLIIPWATWPEHPATTQLCPRKGREQAGSKEGF